MSDLADRLADLAELGEPRGADAVVAEAVAEAQRRIAAPPPPSRRRRVSALAALAAVVAIALVVGLFTRFDRGPAPRNRVDATSGPTTPPSSSGLPGPTVTFRAGDFERVAWVDGRDLVAASSARPTAHVLATGQVGRPTFSPDGRWIAYALDGSLHVMRADGGGDTNLGATTRPFAWSPVGARLAWLAGADSPGQLRISDPATDETVTIHGTGDVLDFAWAPDGNSLAVSNSAKGSPVTGFEILDTNGTKVRTVGFEPATRDYGAGTINPLLFAGWQPDGRAVLVWIDEGGSGSIAQDGLELWLVPLDGSPPHDLGKTLVKREWIQWSPDGSRVAIVRSSNREVTDSPRTVTVCGRDGTCTAVSGADTATMDPSWSPDGRHLAFVSHPAVQPYPAVHGDTVNWREPYAARRLWIANADGSDASEMTAASGGVASPRWSPDGARILYVRDDALWALDVAHADAERVLGPIAPVGKLAPPDAVDEPSRVDGYPTWESLLTWVG